MTRSHDWISSRLPSRRQETLLKAALLEGDDSLLAWKQLKGLPETDLQTPTNKQLLPLLYRNLKAQGVSESLPYNLKIASMMTWTRNHRIFQRIQQTLPILHDGNVPTLLLKGAALIPLYYQDYGVRGMGDFDLLVPQTHFRCAVHLLVSNGWKPMHDRRVEYFDARFDREMHMVDGEDNCLDLHCHVLDHNWAKSSDYHFWEASVPAKIANVETRTLCPTDHLIHACVHGFHGKNLKPVTWVADAGIILRRASREIDWDRIAQISQDFGITLQVSEAMGYLRKTFDWKIPQAVLDSLRLCRVSRADRTFIRLSSQDIRGRPLKLLLWRWLIYINGMGAQKPLSRIFSISEYLKYWLEADSSWEMASTLVKRICGCVQDRFGWCKDDQEK